MRTPERGQLEAYTIGCQKPPRGFSGQPRHTVTCPRLDLLYQTAPGCARGESKKLRGGVAPPSRRLQVGVLARRAERETRSGQPVKMPALQFILFRQRPPGWYNGSMKEKTSITLSKEVLTGIDRIAGSKQSRSAFIEAVLTQYLRKRARAQVEARDLELINKAANELNAEVEDILRYQDPEA